MTHKFSLAELTALVGASPDGKATCLFPTRHSNGDRTPSMSVFQGKDGSGKLKCHGCNAETKELMGEAERRAAEPFFSVLALLGGTHVLRTHEIRTVHRVRQVMDLYQP